MDQPVHYEYLPLSLVGVFFILAAITNANVFYSGGRAQLFVRLIGRTGVRLLYAATGLLELGFAVSRMFA